MTSLTKQISLCISLFLAWHMANAQTNPTENATPKSSVKADLNYLSNLVYLGRKDSITTPYITSSIGYFHQSGFYASAAVSYIPSKPYQGIDLYTLDAGYEFNINDLFSGSVYAEKYFYNQSSNSIKSDISGMVDATLEADIGFLQINAEAGLSFATKKDVNASIGIAHLFESAANKKGFSFTPSLILNFNTLNYFEGYSNKKISKKQLAINPNFLSISATTTANKHGLTFMDWELSLPMNYDYQQWSFYLTPYCYFPQNPINTSTNAVIKLRNGGEIKQVFDSTPWSEKNLSTGIYIEAGISFHF